MSNPVHIGRRLIPVEQIALVGPFEPSPENPLRSEREFKSRIVLLNRESVLAEIETTAFAKQHGFRMLGEDVVATNPAVHFSVEGFEPSADFQPSKPFRSRVLSRDLDGNTQSKLLLTSPEAVLALTVRGGQGPESSEGATQSVGKQKLAGRRRSRRRVNARTPLGRAVRGPRDPWSSVAPR